MYQNLQNTVWFNYVKETKMSTLSTVMMFSWLLNKRQKSTLKCTTPILPYKAKRQ